MRFKQQRPHTDMPDVNLVPMMDVLMTVLTFFIIVSMTLTGQRLLNVNLPQTDGTGTEADKANRASLTIGLNSDGQLLFEDRVITSNELAEMMVTFLTEYPDGVVLLKADRDLNYSQVAELLRTMRNIGGSRVSLAIEREASS